MVLPLGPPAVHTLPLDVVKVTVSPDDEVAATVIGDCWRLAGGSGPKVIVCVAWLTVNVRVIDVAGA